MRKHFVTATLYTIVTAFLLGLVYPMAITGIAHLTMRDKADGQLIIQKGEIVGSALIGQAFTGPGFFHSRPSAAGTGYDASASSGSNYGPTNKALVDRVNSSVSIETSSTPVPVDLVTASGSGLDPDITPAAALFQIHRVALESKLSESELQVLVNEHVTPRQFGLLGEARVNVLSLNLALSREQAAH